MPNTSKYKEPPIGAPGCTCANNAALVFFHKPGCPVGDAHKKKIEQRKKDVEAFL